MASMEQEQEPYYGPPELFAVDPADVARAEEERAAAAQTRGRRHLLVPADVDRLLDDEVHRRKTAGERRASRSALVAEAVRAHMAREQGNR